MTTKDILHFRNNYSVGQKIHCEKPLNGDKTVSCEAVILEKYPWFCLVTDNHKYKWSVLWADLLRLNG